MAARPTSRVRQSWATYDALVEKAFAKHEDPTMSPEPTVHPLDTVPDNSLDPLWEKVWELKSRALAAMPSKVKSLDTAGKEATGPAKDRNSKIAPLNIQVASRQTDSQEHTKVETPRAEKLPKLKRKSSATFCTSPDGRFVTATFDMLGVHKQDMHVSFRANWVVVTWRRVKTTEKMEDRTLVRERKEKQYCQSIPLPEGTTFEDVRASRDGQRLVIRYPNSRCVRVEALAGDRSGATSSTACSEDVDFQTCLLAPSTMEVFEVERQQ